MYTESNLSQVIEMYDRLTSLLRRNSSDITTRNLGGNNKLDKYSETKSESPRKRKNLSFGKKNFASRCQEFRFDEVGNRITSWKMK